MLSSNAVCICTDRCNINITYIIIDVTFIRKAEVLLGLRSQTRLPGRSTDVGKRSFKIYLDGVKIELANGI